MALPETTALSCATCKRTFTVAELIDGVFGYQGTVNAFVSKVPCCGAVEELQIRSSIVTHGYTYSAGSLHFEGFEDYQASGLRVHRRDTMFEITHHGRAWTVPIDRPGP